MRKEAKRELINEEKVKKEKRVRSKEKRQSRLKIAQVITKKRLAIATVILMLMALVGATMLTYRKSNKSQIMDPELARAMTYEQFREGDDKVSGTNNIKFSAFFLRDLDDDGYAEAKLKGTCKKIKDDKDMLYVELKVLTEGYLENGKIEIVGKNFNYIANLSADNIIAENYVGQTSVINLKNKVYAGSQKLIESDISSKIGNNINNYSKENYVILTGTYVDDEGNTVDIDKRINLTVDWYSETDTKVNVYRYKDRRTDYKYQRRNINDLIKNDKLEVDFTVAVSEMNGDLILKKQGAIVEIPEINGYKPNEIYLDGKKVTDEYNDETGELEIVRESQIDSKGNIVSSVASANINEIKLIYPLEAYESMDGDYLFLSVSVKGYNYGYNNTNEEFMNPHYSEDTDDISVCYEKSTQGEIWGLYADVGKMVYESDRGYFNVVLKQKPLLIYNGNQSSEEDDLYDVQWEVVVGKHDVIDSLIIEEVLEEETKKTDEFIDENDNNITMRDYIATTQVSFKNAINVLGVNGWIILYNGDSGEEIDKLTHLNWNNYQLNTPVKSIKIKTSEPVQNGSFVIEQRKKIDDTLLTNNFSREEFDKLSFINTEVYGTLIPKEGYTIDYLNLRSSDTAYYESPYSYSKISLNKDAYSNQNSEEFTASIITDAENFMEEEWRNGKFLIEFPEEIVNVKIESVLSEDSEVRIKDYSLYKAGNKLCLRISVENNELKQYKINVKGILTPNPLIKATNTKLDLYYYNEYCDNYSFEEEDQYDVDNDLLISDKVGYNSCNLKVVVPSGISTSEFISNYDEMSTITIAPNVAEIDKSEDNRTATININVTNNYSGTISDIVILGRTPFEGNKYILADRELNSNYTAEMQGPISIPDSVNGHVNIYYSSNENASKNYEDSSNNWKTDQEIENWGDVKSYLILFGDYALPRTENLVFSYDVKVPDNIKYEKTAYSNHAIYCNLDTYYGKYYTEVEPSKVGIRMVSKYDLRIDKIKINNGNMKVRGALFAVKYLDEENIESKLETSKEDGIVLFKDLNVGREYTLKEISTNKDYVVNEDEIKFVAEIDNDDNLVLNVIEGSFSGEPEIVTDEHDKKQVNVTIEDEAKYTIHINKTNENGEALKDIKFAIRGKDKLGIYCTNEDGSIVIDSLNPYVKYYLQEYKAEGYYVDKEEKEFEIIRNDEKKLELLAEDSIFDNATIDETDGIAQANIYIDIKNEKVPTYDLEIIKVETNNNEVDVEKLKKLSGARYIVTSEDEHISTEYTTDENGKILIEDLYEYVEGKNRTAQYIIKESKEPIGYTLNPEEIKLIVRREEDKLVAGIKNKNKLTSIRDVIIENNKVKIFLQDDPLFKLTKIDKDTGEPLKNIKFAIYELDDNGEVVDFAKDVNGNYIGNIDGDLYYVETDENGVITIPLREGTYKAIELNTPDGYIENKYEEIFKVEGEPIIETTEESLPPTEKVVESTVDESQYSVIEISSIEDLVDFANNVNNGNHYEKTRIELSKTLDFNENTSYENAERTDYGDINENGTVESLKQELTTGKGFKPIGIGGSYYIVNACFDGKNNEIKNLFINRTGTTMYVGLFGYIINSEIRNLTVSGNIDYTYSGTVDAGGIAGYASGNCKFKNCINKVDTSISCTYLYYGGIVGYANKIDLIDCTNMGAMIITSGRGSDIGGIIGYSTSLTQISGCINEQDFEIQGGGYYIGGIIGGCANSKIIIENSTNNGALIIGDCNGAAGIIGDAGSLLECYKVINNGNIYADTNVGIGGIVANIYKSGSYIYESDNNGDLVQTVARYGHTGGIVGGGYSAYMYIYKCNQNGNIRAEVSNNTYYIGGIVAEGSGYIISCNMNGKFENFEINSKYLYFGGIAGSYGRSDLSASKIKNCNNYSDIYIQYTGTSTSGYNYLGGIIGNGYNISNVENCNNYGKIHFVGANHLGGVIGHISNTYNSSAVISNCNNYKDLYVEGDEFTGGVIGYISGSKNTIKYCNNYGNMNVKTSCTYISFAGGILADASGNAVNCNNYGNIILECQKNSGAVAGGIVGRDINNVENCHNSGNISVKTAENGYSVSNLGGIVGYMR